MRLETLTKSEEETLEFARRVGALLREGDVVALVGELGAGKTRFVRGLAEGMGLDAGRVSSPTYVLLHEYGEVDMRRPPADPVSLVHVDAYRLRGEEDLASLGLDEADRRGVLAIEWADRVSGALPETALRIELTHGGDEKERCIVLEAQGDVAQRMKGVSAT